MISAKIDQERVSSTPIISKTRLNFEINSSLISPIRTPVKNMRNATRNDVIISQTGRQPKLSPDLLLEMSGFDILQTSQRSYFNDAQNVEVTENTNDTQESMYFISRDPKHVREAESDISRSEINYMSNTSEEDSLGNETKYRTYENDTGTVVTSFYFDDSKNARKNQSKFNKSSSRERNSSLKRNLSEKVKKNTSLKHSNQNNYYSPTEKLKTNERDAKPTQYLQSSINVSFRMRSFSDNSFSDLDKSPETQITMKSRLCRMNNKSNQNEQNSIELECNDSWEQYMNSWSMDVESQNINIESQNYSNKEGIMFSSNSSQKPWPNNKSNIQLSRSDTSSFVFSDDSILCSNSFNNNSNRTNYLDSVKEEFMKWSQEDSFDADHYKESNTLFEKMRLKSNENINIVSIKHQNTYFVVIIKTQLFRCILFYRVCHQ